MITWSSGGLQGKSRHGFKNGLEGSPSLCGRARFPKGGRLLATHLPYCKWCTDKARPPDAPNTGGMHAKGAPWAIEGRWIKPKREDSDYYIPQQTRRARRYGEDQGRRRLPE